MKKSIGTLVFAITTLFVWTGNASADTISPNGVLTDLGFFAAGTYTITGSGVVDLAGDGSISINPDGTPAPLVTNPAYLFFNPNGTYNAGGFGPAGTNAKIGALIGTLTPSPSSPSDWFLIGYSTQVTLVTGGDIYASVNDTYYPNNIGSFEATVSSAVPEPSSLALLSLGGIGLALSAYRRRRAVAL